MQPIKHNFLPPPPGVEYISAWEDGTTGEWYVDRLPLVCVDIIGDGLDGFDAMSVEGEGLGGVERALLLADGRVVAPGFAIYDNVEMWLAEVKKLDEEFKKKRIFLRKPPAAGVQ